MSKHTPGPWKFGQYLGSLSSFCVHMDAGDKGRGIDVVKAVAGITTEQRLANARLIAAAPEMLEALERTLWYVKKQGRRSLTVADAAAANEAMQHLQSVIAKAKGEDVQQ